MDEEVCNPLKVWHDLGEPRDLSGEQKKLLREAAGPFTATDRLRAAEGRLQVELLLRRNGVVYFEAKAGGINSDRGYDHERVMAETAP